MTCAACVGRVQRSLQKLPGVQSASVNLATGRASLEVTPTLEHRRVLDAMDGLGYPSRWVTEEEPSKIEGATSVPLNALASLAVFTLSMALSAPLMHHHAGSSALTWVAMPFDSLLRRSAPLLWEFQPDTLRHLLLALHLPVLWWGRGIYSRAWKSVSSGSTDMDTLVAVGTMAAFGWSTVAAMVPNIVARAGAMPDVYFESVSGVLGFVLLGRWIEGRAKTSARRALQALGELLPSHALRIDSQGLEQIVTSADLVPGNHIRVLPGERIPADGLVLEGTSSLDERHRTGEPFPLPVAPGSEVVGGALNGEGALIVKVCQSGEHTQIRRMARLLEHAQATQAPVQKLADHIAERFVPAIFGVSLATYFIWWFASGSWSQSLVPAIAVLVVACPCALGLAVPSALLVASSRGTRFGVLVRDAAALEMLGRIDTLVFDKTGTLTAGKPIVSEIQSMDFPESELLAMAAALGVRSTHPLSMAIVAEAKQRNLTISEATDIRQTPGFGIEGTIEGKFVRMGRPDWVGATEELRQHGSVISIGVDGLVCGTIHLGDPLRDTSLEAVKNLQADKIRVEILSGDSNAAVEESAKSLGVSAWKARCLPETKMEHIAALRQSGHKVAMVGDGVNDTIAMAQASVAMAMASGSAVSYETAAVSLTTDDPRAAGWALELGRATLAVIRQNLAWAFGYNLLLVPVAAGLLEPVWGWRFSPVLAGVAMSLSSTTVVLNSLRLTRWSPGKIKA